MMQSSGLTDARWRIRSYDFTGSIAELETRWQGSWPEFRWVLDDSDSEIPQADQVLLWKKDVISPAAASTKDIDKYSDKMEFDGFLVSAMQFVADSTAVQNNPRLQQGGTYCSVMLMNFRKVKR